MTAVPNDQVEEMRARLSDIPTDVTRNVTSILRRMTQRPMYYRLDGEVVVPCADVLEWAHWFECATDRTLLHTRWRGVSVSTVFVGMDMGHGKGAPLLWETMAFDPLGGEMQYRYATRDEALEGHAVMVHLLRQQDGRRWWRWPARLTLKAYANVQLRLAHGRKQAIVLFHTYCRPACRSAVRAGRRLSRRLAGLFSK